MGSIVSRILLVVASLGCSQSQTPDVEVLNDQKFSAFEEISDPTANMVIDVSDVGEFELVGVLMLEEVGSSLVPRMSLSLSGFARGDHELSSFALEIPLGSDGEVFNALQLGIRDVHRPITSVRYP